MTTWAFGDWSVPDLKSRRGKSQPGRELTTEEHAAIRQRQLDLEKVRTERRAWKDAAVEAEQRWKKAKPAAKNHPYLRKQQIDPCGARIENGNLLIPMRDIDGKLWSLQQINEDWKSNQPGGRRKGCFTQIGDVGKIEICGETRHSDRLRGVRYSSIAAHGHQLCRLRGR
jgi:putative DNA primase/helicase